MKPKGRPSKYRASYCELLEQHMAGGGSFESFAGVVGVNRDTLYVWCCHPEFSDARKRGQASSLYFWEDLGIRGLMGEVPGFNQRIWATNMRNRFKWTSCPDDQLHHWEQQSGRDLGQERSTNTATSAATSPAPSSSRLDRLCDSVQLCRELDEASERLSRMMAEACATNGAPIYGEQLGF